MNPSVQKFINRVIPVFVVVSFVLGYIGWEQYHTMYELPFTVATGMFLSMQLFTVNTSFEEVNLPVLLEVARFSAPLSLATAALNVFFIFFHSKFTLAVIRFTFRNHYVVYGLSPVSRQLILDLLNESDARIVVVPDGEHGLDTEFNDSRVRILEVGTSYSESIRQTLIHKSKLILLLSDEDSLNMKFVSALSKEQFKQSKQVLVRLNKQENIGLFTDFDLKGGNLELHAFSIHQKCAAYIVDAFAPDRFKPVTPHDEHQVEVLLVGFSEAAMQLLTEAVHMYHFANLKRTRFILTDHNIKEKYTAWFAHYPMIEKAADIEYVELDEIFRDNDRIDFNSLYSIFVCAENDSLTSKLALQFRQIAYRQTKNHTSPVIVAVHWEMQDIPDLVPGFSDAFEKAEIKLADFKHYINRNYLIYDKQTYDTIAKHINAYYEESWMGRELTPEEIDKKWNELPGRLKESNRLPARHLHYKMRILNTKVSHGSENGDTVLPEDFSDETFYLLARIEKNRWNAEKYIQGFVPGEYHEDKAIEKKLKTVMKIHPALKPWEEISKEEQEKDATTLKNITQILKRAGLKLIQDSTP